MAILPLRRSFLFRTISRKLTNDSELTGSPERRVPVLPCHLNSNVAASRDFAMAADNHRDGSNLFVSRTGALDGY